MSKTLFIVVGSYPFGYREPFLHEEVLTLSTHFKHIYLVVPSASKISEDEKPSYVLPENVHVIHLKNSNTSLQKILTFFRYGPLRLIKFIRQDSQFTGDSFDGKMFRILFYYLSAERDFRLKLLARIKKMKLREQEVVLYSYWFTEFTYSLLKIKKAQPKFRVFTRMHGWDVYFERHSPPYLPLRKKIIEGMDGVFPISHHTMEYLVQKFELNKNNLEVLHLGVTSQGCNPGITNRGILQLLSVSLVIPIKNIELIIDSLSEIKVDIQVVWTHFGGGDYFDYVFNYAKEKLNSNKNITFDFRGTRTSQEIRDFMINHPVDLLINTSLSEGLPVSMMEAMSASIPVMGPCVGGIPEMIENRVNGYLLSSKPTPGEILKVLSEYMEMSQPEVAAMKKNAYSTWENRFNATHNYKILSKKLLKD